MEDRVTYLTLKMKDDSKVQLTLSFGRLYQLRQKAPDAYEKYNQIAIDGMKDEFQFITYLYTAYLCANIENMKQCMSEEQFIELLPDNHVQLIVLTNQLRFGEMKKKPGSGHPFRKSRHQAASGSPDSD